VPGSSAQSMDRPTMKVSEPVRYRKRVQASTGTLNNMAAAHAIAPIRRIVFTGVPPNCKMILTNSG
jgi:UDP-N-acetylglucosamine 2-epimerase